MAGLHRRKFITILSDMFTVHYRGKVSEQTIDGAIQELAGIVARLDSTMKDGRKQRAETLRKLKRLPLEKLQEMLSVEM